MELLFQRPTLVRAFYYFENRDYLCWHTHDDDLTFQRKNIIYLYRDPISTIYSQLRYLGADTSDAEAVKACTLQYREHLTKWLLRESFSHRKLLISYRDLEQSPLATLQRLAGFLRIPWDESRAREAITYVTKDIVRLKTQEHDNRVIDTGLDYSTTKEIFTTLHATLIQGVIHAGDVGLQSFFRR